MTRSIEPTVLVVDDDEAVRDSLAMVLRAAGRCVETFASAEEFIERGGATRAGCLVLDVRMPGMSGLELQDYLAQRNAPLPIVFLTGHGDIPMAVRAVRRGAWEFLQKPVDDGLLLAAVDSALSGDSPPDSPPRALPPAVGTLSRREREVLDLILAGKQTRAIAEALFISVKTVEFHRSRIHSKLGVASMAELFNLCLGGQLAPRPVASAALRA
ncbi:MAG: response regulator transcription factor [Burkholderiales bacterium]|nr:response regulator transcription factor [Burkholderiales bacterium]